MNSKNLIHDFDIDVCVFVEQLPTSSRYSFNNWILYVDYVLDLRTHDARFFQVSSNSVKKVE